MPKQLSTKTVQSQNVVAKSAAPNPFRRFNAVVSVNVTSLPNKYCFLKLCQTFCEVIGGLCKALLLVDSHLGSWRSSIQLLIVSREGFSLTISLKHNDTLYIDTKLCHLNIFIVMNKNYETTNCMIHWCVYFIV